MYAIRSYYELAEYLSETYMEYINSQNLTVNESAVGFDLNQDGDMEDTVARNNFVQHTLYEVIRPTATPTPAPTTASSLYEDGTYTGSGTGFRGTTNVSVTVEGGYITDITIVSYQDDTPYFNRAQSSVLPDIIDTQGIDVDTVSGATFSSNGIIEAVADALGLSFTNPNSSRITSYNVCYTKLLRFTVLINL